MKFSKISAGLLTLCLLALGSQFCSAASITEMSEEEDKDKIDDWEYVVAVQEKDGVMSQSVLKRVTANSASGVQATIGSMAISRMAKTSMSSGPSLGFAVGGAKDADNFFQNLQQGYLPRFSSLTYEGLFYDYTFDTGQQEVCKSLFCPSYSRGVSKDLFSGETNYYLSVGLNSGLTEESFKRKKLNLVVVLDISGSMSSSFNSYYYDTSGNRVPTKEGRPKSKMAIANQSIVAMLKHLHDTDRFAMVLFDNSGYRAKPFRPIATTNMQAISTHILDLKPRGGTNMSSGLQKGIAQFAELNESLKDPNEYENRIIFLTDAMPNRGELRKDGLFSMVGEAAKANIFTSFIGIGIDFNPDLIEHITKTRGANYYAVHSSEDFKKRLDDEFDFMVTPLVFDLELQLQSKDYEIKAVFGSPEADLATGQMLQINTLFPSSTEDEEVRGGVVLVKLAKKTSSNTPLQLTVSYKDRNGERFSTSNTVQFDSDKAQWDNLGIRKAALLSDYVSLLKNWLIDSRKGCNDTPEHPVICFPYFKMGLIHPDLRAERSRIETWERRSCPLEVSEGYIKLFSLFKNHFAAEMAMLDDPGLQKEMDVLDRLTEQKGGKKMDDWKIQK